MTPDREQDEHSVFAQQPEQGDALALDKETLKDLEPSDQGAVLGGRNIIPTQGLKDAACPVYTPLNPPPVLSGDCPPVPGINTLTL